MKTGSSAIMIFGAGINQLELIREAKLLGLVSVVIDPQESPPGRREADFYYQVEGSDYERTKEIAVSHNITGIVTGQMEKPLRLMAKLANELGYIFHSPEVTERCLDKWLMKEAFLLNYIPCAEGTLISPDENPADKLTEKVEFPLIMKPRDAFSSRGVYKVNSLDDILSHLAESRNFASNGEIILEEFFDGREYSVEAITYHGKTTVVQFTQKFITSYPNTVELGHLQPADLTNKEKQMITEIIVEAIEALGIDNSASHSEIILTTEGPKVIEIGARLGGDFIASYLTKASTGISMDRAAIQVALGIRPELDQVISSYSMIRYFELPLGKVIKEILPIDDIINHTGVVMAFLFISPGEKIMPITHSARRPGCVIVSAESRDEVLELEKEASNKLVSRIIF